MLDIWTISCMNYKIVLPDHTALINWRQNWYFVVAGPPETSTVIQVNRISRISEDLKEFRNFSKEFHTINRLIQTISVLDLDWLVNHNLNKNWKLNTTIIQIK